jgi:voltage-gated potassium channel Kch
MAPRITLPKSRPPSPLWSSDGGLVALLGAVLLLEFVFLPLEASGWIGPGWIFLVDVWTAGVLIAGASALGWKRLQRGLIAGGLVAVLVLLAVHIWARSVSVSWVEALRSVVATVVFSILTALILGQVFRAGPTTRARIFGAVAAYVLLGLVFGNVFRCLHVLDARALTGVHWEPGVTNLSAYVYFSLSTLTTVGYGDILPVSLAARAVANLEALAGQLFPAILIARLVSLEVANRPSPR